MGQPLAIGEGSTYAVRRVLYAIYIYIYIWSGLSRGLYRDLQGFRVKDYQQLRVPLDGVATTHFWKPYTGFTCMTAILGARHRHILSTTIFAESDLGIHCLHLLLLVVSHEGSPTEWWLR